MRSSGNARRLLGALPPPALARPGFARPGAPRTALKPPPSNSPNNQARFAWPTASSAAPRFSEKHPLATPKPPSPLLGELGGLAMTAHFAPAARGGINTSGLLAPNPRQGSALHPAQIKLAESSFAASGSGYAAEAPCRAREQPRKGGSGSGFGAGGYAAGGLRGPSRTLGNQGIEVPATICARANLRSGWLTAQQRSHETKCLVVHRVDYVGPFPHRGDPGQLDPH